MTFLNGVLALGALAFTVPLAIHLLFRNRRRVVRWGAMHLIDGLVRENRRRWTMHRWWLLLIRCAIPVLLAVGLARPVLSALRSDGGGPVVVVVDDSVSMDAMIGGRSAWVAAREGLRHHVRSFDDGRPVMLVDAGGGDAVDLVGGPAGSRRAVRWMDRHRRRRCGGTELGELAATGRRAAAGFVDGAGTPSIVIYTDAAAATAGDLDPARLRAAGGDASDVVVRTPAMDRRPSNVSVRLRGPDRGIALAGRPQTWSAVIRNDTDAEVRAGATLTIDGKSYGKVEAMVPADGAAPVRWEVRLEEVVEDRVDGNDGNRVDRAAVGGLVVLELPDGGDDDLAADNRSASAHVRVERVPVAVRSSVRRDDSLLARALAVGGGVFDVAWNTVTDRTPSVAFIDAAKRNGDELFADVRTRVEFGFDGVDGEGASTAVPEGSSVATRLTGEGPWGAFADDQPVPVVIHRRSVLDGGGEVWWRTADGEALTVARGSDGRRVVELAVSPEPAGRDARPFSRWPYHPYYVPMIHALVFDSVDRSSAVNVPVGGNIPPVADVEGSGLDIASESPGWVVADDRVVATSVTEGESDLRPVSAARLAAAAEAAGWRVEPWGGTGGADVVRDAGTSIGADRRGGEIWPALVGICVLAMIAEVAMGHRRGGGGGGEERGRGGVATTP